MGDNQIKSSLQDRTGIYDVKLGDYMRYVIRYKNNNMASPIYVAGQPHCHKWVNNIDEATHFTSMTELLHFYGRFAEEKGYRPTHHNYSVTQIELVPTPQFQVIADTV